MTAEQTRVLAARWIVPVSRDPIRGGWVRIKSGRIVEIGEGKSPSGADNLGDVALIPGLVNAHTHLEFSDCKTPIGKKGVQLHQWIGQVIASRRTSTPETRAAAIRAGLGEMMETGTRIAAEITTPPTTYPLPFPGRKARIELVSFAEVIGLDCDRAAERLDAAAAHNHDDPRAGWSPHAPYSTIPQAIDTCIAMARKHDRPLAMHVAESPAERELLRNGTGPFAESLRTLKLWREDIFPWRGDPFEILIDRLCKAPRVLLIHGNDLNDAEIRRLSNYSNATIVYCPRTHNFFDYDTHPVDRMLASGVRVALGTDSRASNPDLNLWREVQFLLQHRSDLAPDQVIRMATLSGADALGRPDLGRIEIGCRSEIGAVATTAASLDQLHADMSSADYSMVTL